MLLSIDKTIQLIKTSQPLAIAGDELLLDQLPRGQWIGGTIPYFMTDEGGLISRDQLFVTPLPAESKHLKLKWYDESNLPRIPADAAENGYSVIIIPATSGAHVSFSKNAPHYENMFLKPLIGWISGVHLSDLGKVTPKVYHGELGEKSDSKAVVMHCELPPTLMASIGILNLFEQGDGDEIQFENDGFHADTCLINGQKANFAGYLLSKQVDTRYPLVSNYSGAMVNVSFQAIHKEAGRVDLYAPVFRDVTYRIARPFNNYVERFQKEMPADIQPAFSCNCILNFLYSELEGKKTGTITGPITFGEIAYQLLNQTLVYLELKEV